MNKLRDKIFFSNILQTRYMKPGYVLSIDMPLHEGNYF
jgi:hypothetical protein